MRTMMIGALMSVLTVACNHSEKKQAATVAAVEIKQAPAQDAVSDHANIAADAEMEPEANFVPPLGLREDAKTKMKPNGNYDATYSQRLIKTGEVSVKAVKLAKCKQAVDSLLRRYGAYYQSERFNNSSQENAYDLSVRIPARYFDFFLLALERGPDQLVHKAINTNDVSEEYVDLQMRLDNRKKYLKRYQELLARAASVKDLMAIEENIRNLQEEIESAEGRLRYLSNQVAYSTLEMHIFTPVPYKHQPLEDKAFFEQLKTALASSWTSLLNIVLWIAEHWLGIGLFSVAGYAAYKRYKKRSTKATQED